ncbi:MAG: MBL fold metallo-hydrolase [Kiritimatiellia bacterium]
MFNLTFLGAAQTTTGSMHLVEVKGKRILLDCGLFQGHRKEAFERNRRLGLDPKTIDAVILSHAHIDHSGNIPSLVRGGFRGRIYTTEATADLCKVMLRDSAHLQLAELEIVNRKRQAQGKNLFEPLYTEEDVARTLSLFEPVPKQRAFELADGLVGLFHNAGHILGSAITELIATTPGTRDRRLVFTGDLGQPNQPILRDYDIPDTPDVLLIESTYADRDHPPLADVKGRLKGFVEDIHQQRSRLVIPAFSVGRTQQILYYLGELLREKRIPLTPVVVDSPLSLAATRIYAHHRECYDEAASDILRQGYDPFRLPGLEFTESVEDSKALAKRPGPLIIISASGMCEGGRILHHLINNITNPRNIVLIVGYQAENTLGRRLVEHKTPVNILGDAYPLEARVHTINALSAHADRTALMNWFDKLNGPALRHAFAIHGEPDKTAAMVDLLRRHGAANPFAPAPGQIFRNL